jgi:DNA adenine methylase
MPCSQSKIPLQPFLKWPGGKRWAAFEISELVRQKLNGTYYEPFLGSAAVYFWLRPVNSVLSDINKDLINTYLVVRDQLDKLIEQLKSIPISRRAYYCLRSSSPADSVERAARFLYLNRTSFSGLYRVNSAGEFNVPYGGGERTPRALLKSQILPHAASALEKANIKCCDFEEILKSATRGDVVYCDPTYTVTHDNNGFVRYNEKNFSWADQERLANAAISASRRGASVIVSNAHHPSVRKLYPHGRFITLRRQSTLSADASRRGPVKEFLISV